MSDLGGYPSSLGVVRWYLSRSCLVWGTFGSSRIRTGGPGVLSPSLRSPVSTGMRPAGGSGAFSGPPLSFPSPRQRPPTTSASSSGILGHPTRTMNSRPGDAARQDARDGGWAHPSLWPHTLPPLTCWQPAAHTGYHLHPPAPLPCRPLPGRLPAGWLRGWLLLLGRAAGPAPEEEVSAGRGCPESPSSELSSCRSKALTPGTAARGSACTMPPAGQPPRQFPGPSSQSWPVRTSCSSLEERSHLPAPQAEITSSLPRSCHSPAVGLSLVQHDFLICGVGTVTHTPGLAEGKGDSVWAGTRPREGQVEACGSWTLGGGSARQGSPALNGPRAWGRRQASATNKALREEQGGSGDSEVTSGRWTGPQACALHEPQGSGGQAEGGSLHRGKHKGPGAGGAG